MEKPELFTDFNPLAPHLPQSLADLLDHCTAAELELAQRYIANLLTKHRMGGDAMSGGNLGDAVLSKLQELGRAESRSGIIPLDAVRRSLAEVSRTALDATLLSLEQNGAIRLENARSVRPGRAAEGIQSERGLLFFVVLPG